MSSKSCSSALLEIILLFVASFTPSLVFDAVGFFIKYDEEEFDEGLRSNNFPEDVLETFSFEDPEWVDASFKVGLATVLWVLELARACASFNLASSFSCWSSFKDKF